MTLTLRRIALAACALSFISFAQAAIRPDKIFLTEGRKNNSYIRDGLIVGGDASIDDVTVKDIRRATNGEFERIVIDLEGSRGQAQATAISRPPYYQIAVTPDEKRLVFTLFGHAKLAFDAPKILAAFKKSTVIQKLQLYPKVEDDSWTMALETGAAYSVEAFDLSNPVRVIIDIKRKKAGK